MPSAVQGGDRAPGEGFVVLWLGGPGRWEPEVQRLLDAEGVRVEDSGLDVLVERASQRAPDLIVLTGAAASSPRAIVTRLAESHPSRSVPVIAIGPSEGARPKPKSRFGLVATLDREASADTLSKQILQLLRGLSRRPAKWRIKAGRTEILAIAERFSRNARSGLLTTRGAGAIAFDRSVGVAPPPEVLVSSLAGRDIDHLTFHERPPGRIRILEEAPHEDQTSPPLEGARIVVIDRDSARAGRLAARIEGAGGQARAVELDRLAVAAAKSLDPTVIVVGAHGLARSACEALWTEPRLVDASLLVLSDAAFDAPPALLLAPLADLCALEISIRKRLTNEEAIAERLETLGTARWLKVLGRMEHDVTFRVFAAAGRGRVDIAAGRVHGAAFRPSDTRMAMIEGRAAIDALLALPFGRVLAGPPEALAQLEGARASRKMSVIGEVAPTPESKPPGAAPVAQPRGLIAAEVVLRTPDRTAKPAHRSEPVIPRREVTTQPPPPGPDAPSRPSGAPISDLADDEDFEMPTRNYTADAIAELQAELRTAAKVSEAPTEPPPKRRAKSSPPAAATRSDPPPSRVSSRPPPEPRPVVAALPEPLASPPPVAPAAAPASSGNTVWFALGVVVAIAAGGYAAWQLSVDDTPSPPVAERPTPTPDPEPTPEPPPDVVAEPDPIPDPDPPPEELEGDPEEEPVVEPDPEPVREPEVPIEPGEIQLPPEGATVEQLIAQAVEAARRSDYPQSEVHARQALAESPHNADAAYRLAVALYRQQRPDEALEWAQRAAEWDPESPRAHALQGDVYMRTGRFQTALTAYRAALAIEASFGPAERGLERLRARGVTD
ncbi:MAG: tetratricopeptide repeat protein [Sandaracinaceae bacterium]|nr:tetratricopeptide repeat protein [Sandaracinaceae bacterium]